MFNEKPSSHQDAVNFDTASNSLARRQDLGRRRRSLGTCDCASSTRQSHSPGSGLDLKRNATFSHDYYSEDFLEVFAHRNFLYLIRFHEKEAYLETLVFFNACARNQNWVNRNQHCLSITKIARRLTMPLCKSMAYFIYYITCMLNFNAINQFVNYYVKA